MRSRAAVGWVVLLVAGTPAPADAPEVGKLIQQLSASDYKTREAAMRTLESAGETALPDMRLAQPHPDPEVRNRLGQLIARMERTYLITPKLVSVNADQKPADQVFDDLARQTGYKLACNQGSNLLVSLSLQNVPFWEAVDAVCRQTGLGLQPYSDSGAGLTFYRVDRYTPYVHYTGPFRLSGGNFHVSRTLDLAQPRVLNPFNRVRNESLTFMFHVVGEPKAQLMSLGQARVTLAIDDAGNSLLPPHGRIYESNYHQYYYSHNSVLQSQIQLLGPGQAQYIRHLKGTLPITFLAEKRADITIDKILMVKKAKFDGTQTTLEIDEVKEMPGRQVHIRAIAKRNGTDAQQDYAWTNSLAQRVELLDADGRKFQSEGFNWDSGTPTSVTGTFQFGAGGDGKLGKPAKLVYYNWITTQHQIEFEFRDLPLP